MRLLRDTRVIVSSNKNFVFKNIQPVMYPEHVGYPFAENGTHNYYLLEVHMDNPQSLAGITFESGLEIFYTPQLR